MKKIFKDPVSGLTHLLGAIISIVGMIFLIIESTKGEDVAWNVVGTTIFGVGLLLLYLFSALYHLLKVSDKTEKLLRKFDHIMIYILIASTYTAICLGQLRGPWGWSVFGAIWFFTVIGTVLTAVWLEAPRWLTTAIYLAMGWIIVIASYPMYTIYKMQNSLNLFIWLILGGLFYSIGAVIYGKKKPNISKLWGFHEIFHIFILLGSISHYVFVFKSINI